LNKSAAVCLILATLPWQGHTALAINYFWNLPGGSTGLWTSPVSWTPVGVPDSTDSTLFNSSSASLHTIIVDEDTIGGDDFVVQRGLYRLTHDNEPDWEFRQWQRTDMLRIGTSLAGPARLEVIDGIFTMYPELEVGVLPGSDGTLVMTNTQWLYDDSLLISGDSPRNIDIGVDGGIGVFELRGDADFVAENNQAYVGVGTDSSGNWRIYDTATAEVATLSVGTSFGSGTVDVEASLVVNSSSTIGSTAGFGRVNVENGGYWYGGGVTGITVNNNGVVYVAGIDLVVGTDIKSFVETTRTTVKNGGIVTIDELGEYRVTTLILESGGDLNLLAGGTLVTTSAGFQAANLNDFDWIGGTLAFVGDELEITTATSTKDALGSSVSVGSGRTLLATAEVRQGGVMTVLGNATVEGSSGSITQGASVTLSGNNARWNILGPEFIGDIKQFFMSGAGSELNILSGADFFTDTALVLNESAIVLDGAGSTWTGGNVELGYLSSSEPAGALAIRNGGSMTLTGSLAIDDRFQVTMNQGSIVADGIGITDGASIAPAPGALIAGNITVENIAIRRGSSLTLTALSSALIASETVTIEDASVLNAYINGGAGTHVTISDPGSTWTTPNVVATVLGSTTSGIGRIRSLTLNTGAVANLAAGVSYDPTASDGLTLAGGTINAPTFNAGNIGVTGRGTINANYTGSGAIIPNGPLTIGNSSSTAGFATTGQIIAFTQPLTLNDADAAELGSLTSIGLGATPGSILANNGIAIGAGETLAGFGTVNTPNVSFRPLVNNGSITGTTTTERISMPGYVTGAGSLTNVTISGTYSPGNSFETVSTNNLTLAVQSTLMMQMRGTTPGNGHDKIVDAGTLTIGGQLQVSYVNNFNPSLGDTFDLFDFATTTGTFYDLSLPALDPGLIWNTSQLYTSGVLSVASGFLEADFEEDGDVDVNDLDRWQNKYGETGLTHDQGDADGDGDADGRDFFIWQRQYTGKLFLTAENIAVPEPGTLLLALLGIFPLSRRKR
jgi:hypothetical protein